MDKLPGVKWITETVHEDNEQLEDVLVELESRLDVLLSDPETIPDGRRWSRNG
jgi:hypothetical protein